MEAPLLALGPFAVKVLFWDLLANRGLRFAV